MHFVLQVERTKVRPIASGAITPKQGIAFLGLQLSAGLAILTQLNTYRYVKSVVNYFANMDF
jgi:4-hydroxybenzoate polyprenyltransferase